MNFYISRKNHNPLFFILNDLFKNDKIRTILVYGGKSSSKTISICQMIVKNMFVEKANTIAFRKESSIIKTTLKKSFNLSFESMKLTDDMEKLEFSYRSAFGEIVLKGLDKDEKAKGIESYKYVYLDEINHFTESEYDQINLSLRGIKGQKVLGSWNPVSDTSWVKTKLVDKFTWLESDIYELPSEDSFVKISSCGKAVLIKTTYLDNYWIVGSPCGAYGYRDESLINEYESLKQTDPKSYLVNVLGEWGTVQNDNPAFYSFKETNYSRGKSSYTDGFIDLSFDFNISPCTLIVGNNFKVIDLILADTNTIKGISPLQAVCELFKKKYLLSGQVVKERIRITGDASGASGSADRKENESFYTAILLYLQLSKRNIFIRNANIPHAVSIDLINYAFQNNAITIHGVEELKQEIEQCYIDNKNSINEAKKEYGLHTLDAFRYLADFWFCNVGLQGFLKDIKEIRKRIKILSNQKINI